LNFRLPLRAARCCASVFRAKELSCAKEIKDQEQIEERYER